MNFDKQALIACAWMIGVTIGILVGIHPKPASDAQTLFPFINNVSGFDIGITLSGPPLDPPGTSRLKLIICTFGPAGEYCRAAKN